MSLLIRRDATLGILGALHLGIFDQPHRKGVFGKLQMREQKITLMQSKTGIC